MAEVETGARITRGFSALGIFRQIGLLVGLAASIAIGAGIVTWSLAPDYRILYSGLVPEDMSEIASVLERSGIKYSLSEVNGAIMVPSSDVKQARMMLAGEGLPRGNGAGYELLAKESGFGSSHFMESIRYQRALEGELSRTIASIETVRHARVHIAIPENSSSTGKSNKTTASVTIELFPGRNMEDSEVNAISHLVAASIPDLEARNVTVIDQKGRMLSKAYDSADMRMTSTQLAYRKNLENYYISRIENILTPILGERAVRAQVSADIDFAVTEQTQEKYNPDIPSIRSEELVSEKTQGGSGGGTSGSKGNQSSVSGTANDDASGKTESSHSSRKTLRKYELDKTISHTRFGGSSLRRLSIAVVVNNGVIEGGADTGGEKGLSEEKLASIKEVVKNAVGFDEGRGDAINIISSKFIVPVEEGTPVRTSVLDNPNIIIIGKYLGAGVILLVLIFGLLKPVLKELAASGRSLYGPASRRHGEAGEGGGFDKNSDGQAKAGYESNINHAQAMSAGDPRRVAQVVNNWVSSDG